MTYDELLQRYEVLLDNHIRLILLIQEMNTSLRDVLDRVDQYDNGTMPIALRDGTSVAHTATDPQPNQPSA